MGAVIDIDYVIVLEKFVALQLVETNLHSYSCLSTDVTNSKIELVVTHASPSTTAAPRVVSSLTWAVRLRSKSEVKSSMSFSRISSMQVTSNHWLGCIDDG